MIYRLRGCELDAARFELKRNGETVSVEPQVLELLLYLIEHRDRAVTRNELFEKLWRGRIVTDSALNSRIKAARSAIGDDGASQAQIRTLHRTGYRFVGPVDDSPAGSPAAQPIAATPAALSSDEGLLAPPPLARRRFGLLGAALGLLLAVGAFSLLPRDARDLGSPPAVASAAIAPVSRQSLAVLPFADLSGDPEQRYFVDGISVELMKVLSHLPDLLVTNRTSTAYFEGRNETSAAIGEQLGVAHLLTGSVRKAGDHVRITVELVDAASGYQLWADSYDRELGDIFEVQDEIAAHVATALQVKLGLGESAEIGMTRNVEAYDAFLRGYAAYNEHTREAFPVAIEHMHRAIALDPKFSRAWAYLYCIYLDGANVVPERGAEWARKSVESLERARSVTPDSPFVHILEAREDMRFGRLVEARATLDALPDGYWTADRFVTRDVFLGRALLATGHAQDAVEALERARAADPLSAVADLYLAIAYAAAGDSGKALAASDRGLASGAFRANFAGNALLIALGTRDADEIRRRLSMVEGAPAYSAIYEAVAPLLDDPHAGLAEVRRIAAAPAPPDFIRAVLIAHWAAYFGDAPLALEQLRGIAHGSPDEGLLWRPVLTDVRKLPGFKELVRNEGLAAYWRENGWPAFCRPTAADDFECT